MFILGAICFILYIAWVDLVMEYALNKFGPFDIRGTALAMAGCILPVALAAQILYWNLA